MLDNHHTILDKIKNVLYLIFITGWLLPKLTFSNINIGIQELTGIIILFINFKVDIKFSKLFITEILYSILLIFFGIFFLITQNDLQGLLIAVRIFLFVIVSLGISTLKYSNLFKLLKSVFNIYFVFVLISVIRILLNFYYNSFDLFNLLYGSDTYRVRAPFENRGASSQVPIGYMLALLFTLPPFYYNNWLKKIFFLLGSIGTTSRASIISIILILTRKVHIRKILSYFVLVLISILFYFLYLKSFSHSNSGELDGSTNKRLELYLYSLQLIKDDPTGFFLGFGISSNTLENKTGESFFESFIINSFMQGGIFLFLVSICIILKSIYYDYKFKLNSISFVLIIGNLVGGSNYFSMYAYPLMVLIIIVIIKARKTLT